MKYFSCFFFRIINANVCSGAIANIFSTYACTLKYYC